MTEQPARPTTIGFLLIRDFSMMSVVSALEPLRGANRLLGRAAYDWRLFGEATGAARASNAMEIAVEGGLADLPAALAQLDFLFVCAGLDTDPANRSRLNAALSRAARAGLVLGSLSSGAFILARAGLLEGYRCTVHWEFRPAFEEAFPEIDCAGGLYAIDRDRWTGAGGITGLDMMLHLIERDHGPAVSRSVGNQFQVDRIRNAGVDQRPGALERLDTLPAPMQTAITLMMGHIEQPLAMAEVAELSGLNIRRMERLFRAHLHTAPARFYRQLRLERARDLLLHTNLSTLEIGVLTGFSSSSHFAMAYARAFGTRPSEVRRAETRPGHDPDGEGDSHA